MTPLSPDALTQLARYASNRAAAYAMTGPDGWEAKTKWQNVAGGAQRLARDLGSAIQIERI